jgi:CDP-paratose 2-epimerase
MRILVTGGCGLIGFNAAKHFHNLGHEVEVMDNLERSSLLGHEISVARKYFNRNLLLDMNIKVYSTDVSDHVSFEYLPNYDAIIHMAGQCGVPTSIANPRRDYEVNLTGTFNVLETARRTGAKVVFASTNKVYPIKDSEFVFDSSIDRWRFKDDGWHHYGFPAKAVLPPASRTPYGWSKYSADLLCQEYFHTYGVKSGVFRMSCIYGPNQFGFEEQGWATWFVIAMQKRLPINIFGDGKQVRDMLYVGDAVRAYETYLTSNLDHGVFNLGGGPENTLSLNQSLDLLSEMYDREPEITYNDWRPCDQKAYTSDTREIKALGWQPQVSVQEGLHIVRRWVAENVDVF